MTTLRVEGLEAGYGEVQILWGTTLELREGMLTTLVGSNGAGKTTLLRAVMGLIPAWKGVVKLDERTVTKMSAHEKASLGLVLVPEGRQLFSSMTITENLEMGATVAHARSSMRESFDHVFSLFPRLAERRTQLAGTLSGGEQQMLAIACALLSRPKLLLLDEPSLGLAPQLVQTIFRVIKEINAEGTTILLVEQNAHMALVTANRGYVMETGRIVMHDDTKALLASDRVKKAYLGG